MHDAGLQGEEMKPTKTYISGPMSGVALFNFPRFNEAAAQLESEGWEVFNPASSGVHAGWGLREYMRVDIPQILDCHCLFMLSGWQYSKGAVLEAFVAQWLGIPCYEYESRHHIKPDPIYQAAKNVFEVMGEGIKKHAPDSWRDEPEDNHIDKSLRHALTYKLIRDGNQTPDNESHIRMFHCRAALALAVVQGDVRC
jgi:hypothetical protein